MTTAKRPRVAAIGLDSSQAASIASLCGEIRQADTVEAYTSEYNWTETDLVVSTVAHELLLPPDVNLMTVGPTSIKWTDTFGSFPNMHNYLLFTLPHNTERELAVTSECPDIYKPLAGELIRQLTSVPIPPTTILTIRDDPTPLIATTSGHPVALRIVLPPRSRPYQGESPRPIALILPETSNLLAWFRAFLIDLHQADPIRVPQAPPHIGQSSDWYSPGQRVLADRISQIDSEIDRLSEERSRLQAELAEEGQRADSGIRRVLWSDGDELVASAKEVFSGLNFAVRNMDEEKTQGEPKREDLRLALPGKAGWEAMVEVKGYTNGTRTNDSRQIREYRDRYFGEEGRQPDLTIWLSNPFRKRDPCGLREDGAAVCSFRPPPETNVVEAAANIGAVYVLTTDLYRTWALVAAGKLNASTIVNSLVTATPGLWTPPAYGLPLLHNSATPPP